MSDTILMILNLLCGVALFLYGMSAMGDGLKKVAGNKLELVLYKLTNSPLKGFLLGTGVTAVIQSSSAAAVMVVGFVNSGMMKVTQAIGVILGANIGTSITGWIICLSYIDAGGGIARFLSSSTITAVVAILGILLRMFAKKDTLKHVGTIMMGFAVLMVGMSEMSGAVSPLRQNPVFINIMTSLQNPFLGILFGIAFAAVLQSASASVGVLQALSTTGAITFASAFPMLLGIGVGASAPVLLAALGANKNGQRTSLIYLTVSVLAMVLSVVVYYPLNFVVHFPFANMVMDPFSIAFTNTLFRALCMVALLPFCRQLKALVYKLVPENAAEKEDTPEFEKLEERLLANPVLAYEQSMQVLDGMARATRKSVDKAFGLLDNYTQKDYNKVADLEQFINKYEDKLGNYLIRQTGEGISVEQGQMINKALQALSDFEDISDYSLKVADIAKVMNAEQLKFSPAAEDEITVIIMACIELVHVTIHSFVHNEPEEIKRAFPLKELIDIDCNEIKQRHVQRLKAGKCHMQEGVVLNDLLSNVQRMAAHCVALALDVVKGAENDFNTHRFLRKYQEETKNEYSDLLKEYEVKYGI